MLQHYRAAPPAAGREVVEDHGHHVRARRNGPAFEVMLCRRRRRLGRKRQRRPKRAVRPSDRRREWLDLCELPAGAPGRVAVREHKEQVESILNAALAEVFAPERAAGLVEQLGFVIEGAVARAGLQGSAERLVHARTIAASVVDAA